MIANLINLSFKSGTFSPYLKHASVTPVFKKGEKAFMGNYRPISILPALSKVYEKSINSRLIWFLDNFGISTKIHFGFRPAKSTEHALIKLIEFLYDALNRKN